MDQAKPAAKQRVCRHTCDAAGFKVRDASAAKNQILSSFRYSLKDAVEDFFNKNCKVLCENFDCRNQKKPPNYTSLVLPKYFVFATPDHAQKLLPTFTCKKHNFRVIGALAGGDYKSTDAQRRVGHAMAILPDNIENPQVWYQYNDAVKQPLDSNWHPLLLDKEGTLQSQQHPAEPNRYRIFLIENLSYREIGEPLKWII